MPPRGQEHQGAKAVPVQAEGVPHGWHNRQGGDRDSAGGEEHAPFPRRVTFPKPKACRGEDDRKDNGHDEGHSQLRRAEERAEGGERQRRHIVGQTRQAAFD